MYIPTINISTGDYYTASELIEKHPQVKTHLNWSPKFIRSLYDHGILIGRINRVEKTIEINELCFLLIVKLSDQLKDLSKSGIDTSLLEKDCTI